MKIDIIKTLIAIAVSALIAYGFYSFHNTENTQLLTLIVFIELFITSFLVLGLRFELNRTTIHVRTVSTIFFFVFLIINILFSFFSFSIPVYIILNGLLFLTNILIVYSLLKAKQ
jgi:hypothetical protein